MTRNIAKTRTAEEKSLVDVHQKTVKIPDSPPISVS